MAEGVGFEPTVRSHAQRFSRPPQSATLAPLRNYPIYTQPEKNANSYFIETGSKTWRLKRLMGSVKVLG
jgi:hypothetical protein